METQDHKSPKQSASGHEGQVHLCQKCGWPFPNPHPSARHRRTHKKVCGKIKGYELGDDVLDKTQLMDGSDGEHVSDDEGKNPSGKAVENTIIRKSSSGVGSRSSRSTRSEEELFADAATDFTDGSGSGDASEAVMQRFYSMQNDSDDTNIAEENASADNTSAPNLLKDNQDQIDPASKLTSEDEAVEAGIASQVHTPNSAIGTVEQDMTQLSKTPHELQTVANSSKEVVSSEQKPEMRTSYDNSTLEASEDVSHLRATDEVQVPISIAKLTGMESSILENNIECSHAVDALGNFSSPEHSVEVVDATNGSTCKMSDAMEDHVLKTETHDDLPLPRHPDVVVEDREVGDNKKMCSEGSDIENVDAKESKLDQNIGQNSVGDLNIVGEPSQIPYTKDSDVDNCKLQSEVKDFMSESLESEKVSSSLEQKPVDSLEKVLPKGDISDKNSTDHVLLEIDDREITSKELSGISLLADCATDDIPPPVKELSSIEDSKDMGTDIKTGDIHPHLERNEKNEDEGRTYDHVEFDVQQDSRDMSVDQSLPLVESTGISLGLTESNGEDGQGSLRKSDHSPDSISSMIPGEALEVCEDAQCSLRSSAVDDICTDKFVEETSGTVESGRINPIKQHVAISAVDVPDSSSQADSVEGNWGSVSVISALSDTPPAADTPASLHSQTSPPEQNVSLEPKSLTESQHSDGQTSVDPNVAVRKMEDISEIQTLEEQQPKGTVSSAGHVENASLGGKRDEEIIVKVTNWSTEKNHTPLKTLLGEATARSRAESPIHYNQSTTSMPQKDEIPVANNGFSKTEKVIHSSNDPLSEASKEEVGKEWNSPARYPVNIKTEKGRGKNSSWMSFFCCSSVNAR